MFENSQMRRTEELLQDILLELRIVNSGLESLPERFREVLLNTKSPAAPSPTKQPLDQSPAAEDVSSTDSEPAPSSDLKNNLPEFDLDSFLKNNLNKKE